MTERFGNILLDVAAAAVLLGIGNVLFRHFEPFMTLPRRLGKYFALLAATAAISYFFGRRGVVIAYLLTLIPLIYVHGFWLPKHGVNGWTGEPREKYYALRGFPPPPERPPDERR